MTVTSCAKNGNALTNNEKQTARSRSGLADRRSGNEEAEMMLRDIAFVLAMTARVKREMCGAGGKSLTTG